ncbi:hypothetical protein TSUD_137570 [Trifolium subterraneum]|uniref:Reverse transcriptase zinc-binding domain-containing protein n=1 Tax=Trifolium subterraneum TaxID=3900 RepID=A0A2Z6PFI7_TRISU|nr:hypothetical protein TSUD_137570 [Trifolium subterraneum]
MLKAKYHPKATFLKATPKQVMSYSWKSILQASWILKKGCYWTVGKGDHINIWEDNWIHQKGNSNTWSKKPTDTEYIMVKDIMNSETQEWNDQVINEIFLPQEAQKIYQLPMIDRSQPDTLTWAYTMDGNYTVKTGYQAIIEWEGEKQQDRACSSNIDYEHWNMLWKLKVPPKQSHLIWRILNGALPLKANLLKKDSKGEASLQRKTWLYSTNLHVYSCPSCNGNFSNVSMSFSTHINMSKKELKTSAQH